MWMTRFAVIVTGPAPRSRLQAAKANEKSEAQICALLVESATGPADVLVRVTGPAIVSVPVPIGELVPSPELLMWIMPRVSGRPPIAPAESMVPPVWVLAPVRISSPALLLVRLPAPLIAPESHPFE